MEAIVKAEKVSRVFEAGRRKVCALREVDLEARAGEVVVLRGRSGSGKTTLLNLLAGLDTPTAGRIIFLGRAITAMSQGQRDRLRRSEIGMVFQTTALFPFLSALENVEVALRIGRGHIADRRARCEQWMRFVGLGERLRHRPAELSGGEQQRVAIARAVARQPVLLLADEPTAALDTRTGGDIVDLFVRLARERRICVVLSTHDPAVMERADRIYSLEDGGMMDNDGGAGDYQPAGSHQDLPQQNH